MGRRRKVNVEWQEKIKYISEKMYPHLNSKSYRSETTMKKEEDYEHSWLIYKIKEWATSNFFSIHEKIHTNRKLIEYQIGEIIEGQRKYAGIRFPLYKREITINLNNVYIINVIYSLKETSLISITEYENENINHGS